MKNKTTGTAKVSVYHKPSCITCKKTISEMERMKVDLEKRDFFKDKLTENEIKGILKISGLKASDLLRKSDKLYKQLNLEEVNKTEAQLVKLLVEYPGLIKRPIIISGDNVYIGKINYKQIKKG